MKTHSFHHLPALLCAGVIAIGAPLRADDFHLRLKVPNPVRKIVKEVKRVGVRVGNVVVRTAERIDGNGEREEVRTQRPPIEVVPVPPADGVSVRIEPPRPPMAAGSDVEYRYTPVPPDGVRVVVPPPLLPPVQVYPAGGRSAAPTLNAPAEARGPVDSPMVKSREALPPSTSASTEAAAPVTVVVPGARGQPSVAAPAGKPIPPPEHAYGKPVPGRPGLVYPPGAKEIPENMIDVRDIMPGTKVRDPDTKIVFRVP